MVKIELDTQLSCDLINVFLFTDLLFRHYLHSTKEACDLMLNQHNLSELTFTHLFTNRKIRFFEWCGLGRMRYIFIRVSSLHSFYNYRLGYFRYYLYWFYHLWSFEAMIQSHSFWRKQKCFWSSFLMFVNIFIEIRILLLKHTSCFSFRGKASGSLLLYLRF